MPWSVQRSNDCPDDKPWAVINDASGASEGCHATEADAKAQQAALYANAEEGRSLGFDADRVEARSIQFSDIETSSDGSEFEGYASVFDAVADLGDFTESVSRGAYRKVLAQGDNVPLVYEHNMMLPPLATTGGGTLKLEEDGKGLRVRAKLANHFLGEAVRESISRGDVRGMSYGFVAGEGNSKLERRAGRVHRNLVGFKKLIEVTISPDPVFLETEAGFRSLAMAYAAESVSGAQQVRSGAYQQPADGADPPAVDADADETDTPVAEQEEERSVGADSHYRLAAAKRRLQVMQATIPKEFRQ